METAQTLSGHVLVPAYEAYLEGMETCEGAFFFLRHVRYEAYLEGMETTGKNEN